MLPQKTAAIGRKLQRLLPQVDITADCAWAGCFGESDTGLPLIGALPGRSHWYAVLGYGGNGITFSAVAAQIIQRSLSGLDDPDADLFAFRR